MQVRKVKELQRDVHSFHSDMDLLSQTAIQEQQKNSFENDETQYEILKQRIAEHISTLEQKKRLTLLCGVSVIIGIVAIMLGVLLLFQPNTQFREFE